jgi:hypothetical protein
MFSQAQIFGIAPIDATFGLFGSFSGTLRQVLPTILAKGGKLRWSGPYLIRPEPSATAKG